MAQALKDIYTRKYISQLALAIEEEYPAFDKALLIKSVINKDWKNKELKARTSHICECIHDTLNLGFKQSIKIIQSIAPEFTGYGGLFLPLYVEKYGLEDWSTSMKAMEIITPYASAEFAIRAFIKKDQHRAMEKMLHWSNHKNHHVRRLSSEGCRPRLPWAQALPEFKTDPRPILPILNNLKADSSAYVRKSVANNINDISKDNPEIALDIIRLWKGYSNESDWIVKHGARTLLKQANSTTLNIFGHQKPKHIAITNLHSDNKCKIEDALTFSFTISGKPSLGKLRLEYRLHFINARGSHSKKLFKLSEFESNDTVRTINKKHSFKQLSTRKHYPGKHIIEIIVNGHALASTEFILYK